MHKIVNGQIVELTAEEISAIEAEWQGEDDKKAFYEATEAYKDKRKKEYPKIEEIIVALWEKIVEDRPEQAILLQEKRETVKTKYPKPTHK